MPLFPLYAITESVSDEPTTIGQVNVWGTVVFEDSTRALLVFDTREKAKAACTQEMPSVVTIENAYKFEITLEEKLHGTDQPTKVCWNLREDGSSDKVATIPEVLEFIKELPPEQKGS